MPCLVSHRDRQTVGIRHKAATPSTGGAAPVPPGRRPLRLLRFLQARAASSGGFVYGYAWPWSSAQAGRDPPSGQTRNLSSPARISIRHTNTDVRELCTAGSGEVDVIVEHAAAGLAARLDAGGLQFPSPISSLCHCGDQLHVGRSPREDGVRLHADTEPRF